MYLTLCPVTGPRAFSPKRVQLDYSTMRTLKIKDTYYLYDLVDGRMYTVEWKESGFVCGSEGTMIGVTEVHRELWEGVL